ncbi:138aa long hypothetical protein [Pyrococcus horikoshii OT3]|uniref:Uncharacterized protein n=1 Tax=Pyrococcus horikoshii (strain ATCC 700860 / DSM 12428 / JCM 9974 / NBRC 100139 / OT-3) TaxID=70601 RepID=O59061_PYRHO|nr:138aa long hypothetical protein [Pyrococcus horikoshii OT3]
MVIAALIVGLIPSSFNGKAPMATTRESGYSSFNASARTGVPPAPVPPPKPKVKKNISTSSYPTSEDIFFMTIGRSLFIASLPRRGFAFTPFPPTMLSPTRILLSGGMCFRYSRSLFEVFIAKASKSTRENISAIFVPH